MELNLDVQILIAEQMNVSDLLSLAEALPMNSLAIESVLSRRFRTQLVSIETPKHQKVVSINETDGRIAIGDTHSVSKILHYFGPLIKHLQIVFVYNKLFAKQTTTIFQLVNLHCSETLESFVVQNRYSNQMNFDEFNKPFKTVTDVFLVGEFNRLDSRELSFSEIFPAVQRLTIHNYFKLLDRTSLEARFPHLNTLNARICILNYFTTWNFHEEDCKTLIRNHLTLQNVTLEEATPSLLRFLAEELNHLEYLELLNYNEDSSGDTDTPIHFSELKTLVLRNDYRFSRVELPTNVTFDQLEEIEVDLPTNFTWLELVQNQTTLKVLKIHQDLTLDLLLQLEEANLSVVEIQIYCLNPANFEEGKPWLEMDSLIRLIENYRNLKKMTLHPKYNATRIMFELLQNRLSTKWITTITEDEQVIYINRW